MSKKDDIKAKISLFQAIIIVLLTTIFAIFGYTAIHYREFDWVLGICTIGAIVILMVLIGIFAKYFLKYTNKLRKLK